MTNLIETMARAMWHRPVTYARVPFDALDAEDQDVFRAKARAALSAIEAAGYRVVPVEPTPEMLIASHQAALAWMKECGVTGLSPFSEYPSPTETTIRCLTAAIAAAPKVTEG